MYKSSTVLMCLLVTTGCASITGSKLQPVSVQTVQDDKQVAGAACTLTNDAGKWFVTSPGSVTIQKSTGDLSVDCSKDGDASKGHENIVSKANGAVWGNIIAGGGIGYVIDRSTGAGFDYPSNITVTLHKLDEKLGLAAPDPSQAGTAVSAAAPAAPATASAAPAEAK